MSNPPRQPSFNFNFGLLSRPCVFAPANPPGTEPNPNPLQQPPFQPFTRPSFGNLTALQSMTNNITVDPSSNPPSIFGQVASSTFGQRASGLPLPSSRLSTNSSSLPPQNSGFRVAKSTAAKNIVDMRRVRGYLELMQGSTEGASSTTDPQRDAKVEEIKTAPLFTNHVKESMLNGVIQGLPFSQDPFPQYGLLGLREETYNSRQPDSCQNLSAEQNLVFANANAPWSAFICGSQGAGKSHSLSCLLENALLASSPAGVNPNALAALVFHYDRFTSRECTQVCEAAYLCSTGIPVRVLVSPSNFHVMHALYSNLPGLSANGPKPQVLPFYLKQSHLNVARMLTLMAVKENGVMPLYMEVLLKILRDMSMDNKVGTFDYLDFRSRLASQGFTHEQNGPLKLRLELLESFLADPTQTQDSEVLLNSMFNCKAGTLTIVDLSCPFVNEHEACSLFAICLSIFMENRGECGRVIALDEAHKFLTQSGEAEKLTDQLTSIVRQQRHLATRVIIATQEPTLAPALLDLCNVAIVHRFNSPAWFSVLKEHLAGARIAAGQSGADLFELIVGLRTGEAFVFCTSALLDIHDNEVERLKDAFVRVRIRSRVTADGGKSLLASEQVTGPRIEAVAQVIRPFTQPNHLFARPPNPFSRFSRGGSHAAPNDRYHLRSNGTSRPASGGPAV